MKRIYYILAFSFILIGIIGTAYTAKDFFAGKFTSGKELYDAEHIDEIAVHSDLANIRILPTSDEEIKVEWSERLYRTSKTNVNIEENEGTLQINTRDNRLLGIPWIGFGLNFNMLHIKVYLPEQQFDSIYVKTNVGSAELSSIHVRDLTVHSDVSSITVTDMITDSIVTTSSVGAIRIKNSTGLLKAINEVGSIDLTTREISNDMTLHTEVGSIKVNVPTIPENVTFSGSSEIGSVKIFGEKGSYINKDSDYIVMMETEVGSIKVKSKK